MKKLLSFLQGKQLICCFFLFVVFYSTTSFSQSNNYSKHQIDRFITEVFGDKSNTLVFNNESRYRLIVNFFSRVRIEHRQDIPLNKEFQNLFDQPLNQKYAKNIQRDEVYTEGMELNILKYNIPMSVKETLFYRLGNTQYFLRLIPKRN